MPQNPYLESLGRVQAAHWPHEILRRSHLPWRPVRRLSRDSELRDFKELQWDRDGNPRLCRNLGKLAWLDPPLECYAIETRLIGVRSDNTDISFDCRELRILVAPAFRSFRLIFHRSMLRVLQGLKRSRRNVDSNNVQTVSAINYRYEQVFLKVWNNLGPTKNCIWNEIKFGTRWKEIRRNGS